MTLSGEAKLGLALAVFLAIATASSAPWWWQYVFPASSTIASPSAVTSSPPAGASPIVGMSGGCEPFQIFAQNRWAPVGTVVREAPNVLSGLNGTYPANMSISVNGSVRGRAAYPTNTPPFNNDVWYHLSDGAGWVSFPGVRATPTSLDPTGVADGGPPVATSPSCEGSVQ